MYKSGFIVIAFCLLFGCQEVAEQKQTNAKIVPVLQPLQGGSIAWHTWAARDSARILNKPILLFLYNQRSYWCRDLVQRCFGHSELVREINRIAWPVWVDVDRQPDVFERFSMGGLPTIAFLMPNEEWIAGGTYFDPEDLMDLLRHVSFPFANPERMAALEEQRSELQRRNRLWAQKNPRPQMAPSKVLLERILDSLDVAVARGVDVGAEGTLALYEARHRTNGIMPWLNTRRDTDGAFFLYAHTPDGQVVDREKHLGINASILTTLATVGQTQKAMGVAGVALGDVLLQSFRVDTLFCAGFAAFETAAGVPRDQAIYAGWNALTVSGLVALYHLNKAPRFQEAAVLTIDAIQNKFKNKAGLFKHSEDEVGRLLLQDQAFMARAALDVYDITGEDKYLQLARGLADGMLAQFGDISGALRDRNIKNDPIYDVGDHWLPSGNGVAAQVFVRLRKLTGDKKYQDVARRLLTILIGPHIDEAQSMGALCRALHMYLALDSSMP